ncbi:hypothetical protein ACFQ0K_14030 [Nocardioides caeni]|uniref:PepSY domain-containing protein n=1 Tax=Nocardioides caeni TaxID=574700 RepID=A0A4S8N1D8_9ACTN|nr:hypothetical protein [Nocardioides caeni]THV09241.1 hypothetical protein E9934_16865 [Nocardioides caeni]
MRSSVTVALLLIALASSSCGDDAREADDDRASTNDDRSSISDKFDGSDDDPGSEEDCLVEESTVATAAEAYYAANGSYPSSLEALDGEYLTDVDKLTYVVDIDDDGSPVLVDDAPC